MAGMMSENSKLYASTEESNNSASSGLIDSTQQNVSLSDKELKPVVFHCCQCNSVVGDSLSWVSADGELHTITLTKVSKSVQLGKRLITSTEGKDVGSTSLTLHCTGCKNDIGRIYKTTPSHMDVMRDLFTFDVEKIDSYQLGSDDQQSASVDPESILTVPKSQYLYTQLRKVQALMVNMNARIAALEAKIASGDSAEEREVSENHRKRKRHP